MKKVKQFLKNNILLTAFLGMLFLGTVSIVWKFTLQAAVDMVEPINRTELLNNIFEPDVTLDFDRNRGSTVRLYEM